MTRYDDQERHAGPAAKRIKLDTHGSSSDSGHSDRARASRGQDTVETLLLPQPADPTHEDGNSVCVIDDDVDSDRYGSPISSPLPALNTFITQQTQLLDTPVVRRPRNIVGDEVQVLASSPPAALDSYGTTTQKQKPSSQSQAAAAQSDSQQGFVREFSQSRPKAGLLASAMAPPGTVFRTPFGLPPARPRGDGLSEDEEDPPIAAETSEDELSNPNVRANIKPTAFSSGGRSQVNRVEDSPTQAAAVAAAKFKQIATSFRYPGSTSSEKQSAVNDMASAYAGTARKVQKPLRQDAPSRAMPVQEDIDISDIPDYEMRQTVSRMMSLYPDRRVVDLRDALVAKKGNYDDAVNHVLERESEDDVVVLHSNTQGPRPAAKRQVKAPNRTIQEKWSSTQAAAKERRRPSAGGPAAASAPKTRKKLVRGRRVPSPTRPVVVDSSPPTVARRTRPLSPDNTSDSDSDSISNALDEDDTEADGRLLTFFNECSWQDLTDLSNQTEEVAKLVLASRPFASLKQVRRVSADPVSAGLTKSGKKSSKKPVGEKIVDVCTEMWTGFEAVDQLVTKCAELAKPVAAEMESWGVGVSVNKADGELHVDSLDGNRRYRDSGIGTPSSSSSAAEDDVMITKRSRSNETTFLKQPPNMSADVELKDYQIVGLNWLHLLWSKKLSCILADDMGLGKTCQVIAFLSHLKQTGVGGVHLVIVPGSTLENWLREFHRFSPSLAVEPYYGLQNDRAEQRARLEDGLSEVDVIVTTYDTAWKPADNKFLRQVIKPVVAVFDEGHALKNSNTTRYRQLMRIPAQFRLLLTGTPLQNNLQELSSLLAFMLPKLFENLKEDLKHIFKYKAKTSDSDHSALLSARRISRARSMMTPFILRRRKHQVLKYLPEKTRRVEYCDLHPSQASIYADQLEKGRQALQDRASGKSNASSPNIMMALRKAAIHPLLFRSLYDDSQIQRMARACLKEAALRDRDYAAVYEDMQYMSDFELHRLCDEYLTTLAPYRLEREWMNSGKVSKLCELLRHFKSAGDRILIFSQFTTVMDILEAVLETLDMQFFRLDGSTPISTRQDMIDEFYKDESVPVFMLSTKAGGSGINLACANKVVIFDSSFNPQEDIQAENRAHRVGQTRPVEVVRLVTRGTIEEQIHALGVSKLALDDRVAGDGEGDGETERDDGMGDKEAETKAEADGMKMVESLMLRGMGGAGSLPAPQVITLSSDD